MDWMKRTTASSLVTCRFTSTIASRCTRRPSGVMTPRLCQRHMQDGDTGRPSRAGGKSRAAADNEMSFSFSREETWPGMMLTLATVFANRDVDHCSNGAGGNVGEQRGG